MYLVTALFIPAASYYIIIVRHPFPSLYLRRFRRAGWYRAVGFRTRVREKHEDNRDVKHDATVVVVDYAGA